MSFGALVLEIQKRRRAEKERDRLARELRETRAELARLSRMVADMNRAALRAHRKDVKP